MLVLISTSGPKAVKCFLHKIGAVYFFFTFSDVLSPRIASKLILVRVRLRPEMAATRDENCARRCTQLLGASRSDGLRSATVGQFGG